MRKSGIDAVLSRRLETRLGSSGRKGVSAQELGRAEEIRELADDPAEVEEALAELERRGRAVQWNDRWLALAGTDLVVGRAKRLPEGNVLLLPEPRGEATHFIHKKNSRGAIDGDRVLVKPHKGASPKGTAGRFDERPRLPEGTIVEILERRNQTVVGTLEAPESGDASRRYLVPFDPKTDVEVEVAGGEDLSEETFVVVELLPARRGRETLEGRVVEVLGDPEQPGVDVEVILRHFRISDEFPADVLAEAEGRPEDPGPEDWEGREDLRAKTLVTIDGATARDFDDAISVERLSADRFRLGVHIADVAHYVTEGSALDQEAYRRGTSVYYPDRAIPMLPERLSNGLCSLRPRVPRLAVSIFLEIDRAGTVHGRRFAETVIESSRRLTYDEVQRILEEPRSGDAEEYGSVLPMLQEARQLMTVLLAERVRRGSIDFDLPSGDVILDTDGTTVGIKPGERHVAHRIVEEFMIAANEAVAEEIVEQELPGLFRVHDAPDPTDLEGLVETLAALGIELEGDVDAMHPSALQQVMTQVAGTKDEPFVSTLVLRTMQRAHYSPECRGHYALASRYYCHFTSPIRRYPDLVVHRSLKSLVQQGAEQARAAAQEAILPERLEVMAEHTSFTERRAESSERDLLQWKKVRFLTERVGETFEGRISGVQPFGLFVQLEDLYVDGLIPIRSLEDDYYVHEPSAHRLIGSDHGRVFQLADLLEVRLVGASVRHRGLDLVPAALGSKSRGNRGDRRKAGDDDRGRGSKQRKGGGRGRDDRQRGKNAAAGRSRKRR